MNLSRKGQNKWRTTAGQFNSVWICRTWWMLRQVIACVCWVPGHYLNQCWLFLIRAAVSKLQSAMLNLGPGPWFNIKMSSYQYRKSHCGDKTVVRSSYLHNGISYTGKVSSWYWIKAQWFLLCWRQMEGYSIGKIYFKYWLQLWP